MNESTKKTSVFRWYDDIVFVWQFLGLGHQAQNQQSNGFVAHFSSFLVEQVDSGVGLRIPMAI